MTMGSTHPLTEMSKRIFSEEVVKGGQCVGLTSPAS
jgi:hypothetical protein